MIEEPLPAIPQPEDFPNLEIHRKEDAIVWKLGDNSLGEIVVDGYLEYISARERIDFLNQAYRVLVPGGKVHITVPYHNHPRAFAHPYIQWPPFSEHSFLFVNKAWREERENRNVPTLTCDFEMSYAYDYDAEWTTRSDATLSFAVSHYGGVVVNLIVNLTKRAD